ncbi:MAG: PASTA domain-containing protein [Ruminococcus sp.]|nr:PASTA domain-containing protein [Ruminococcus sp.]
MKEKEKENISYILEGFEPSSELKRRVMERASKLEPGRKTFGYERTTENRDTQKEQITMNAFGTKEATIKRRFPIAVISAAACAALIIGTAAVGLNRNKIEPLKESEPSSTSAEQPPAAKNEESITQNVMNVTEQDEDPYTITDEDRIAAIDALVEQVKQCRVWEGEKVPASRILNYTINGNEHTVEISEEKPIPEEYRPESELHPEFCNVITVDGASYIICEMTPGEPYSELHWATGRSGDLFFQRMNDERSSDGYYFDEYNNEPDSRRLRDIIEDIRANTTPLFETEDVMAWYDYEDKPDWDNVRATCDFNLNGCHYNIEVYSDTDRIVLDVYDWHDGKKHYMIYEASKEQIAELDKVFDSIANSSADTSSQDETDETADSQGTSSGSQSTSSKSSGSQSTSSKSSGSQNTSSKSSGSQSTSSKSSDSQGTSSKSSGSQSTSSGSQSSSSESQTDNNSGDLIRIPDIEGLTEEEAAAALTDAGLNYIVEYWHYDMPAGRVTGYNYAYDDEYGYAPAGTYITIEVSLGEYDGPVEMIKPEHGTGYYPSRESTLEVPLPEGLSGSFTFNVYIGNVENVAYTETVNNAAGVSSFSLDMWEADRGRQVIYAINNNSSDRKLIRYATYEFDYMSGTWTLIGSLNTEGLLNS